MNKLTNRWILTSIIIQQIYVIALFDKAETMLLRNVQIYFAGNKLEAVCLRSNTRRLKLLLCALQNSLPAIIRAENYTSMRKRPGYVISVYMIRWFGSLITTPDSLSNPHHNSQQNNLIKYIWLLNKLCNEQISILKVLCQVTYIVTRTIRRSLHVIRVVWARTAFFEIIFIFCNIKNWLVVFFYFSQCYNLFYKFT